MIMGRPESHAISRKPPNYPWSGAAQWLLVQYEEIDRKFQIVAPDADERRLGVRGGGQARTGLDLVRAFEFRR